MKTKTNKKKQHPIQADPAYATLTPGLREDIDKDVKGIARQESINGALKWGLVSLVAVLILMSFVM